MNDVLWWTVRSGLDHISVKLPPDMLISTLPSYSSLLVSEKSAELYLFLTSLSLNICITASTYIIFLIEHNSIAYNTYFNKNVNRICYYKCQNITFWNKGKY
jgi:hypothetical protein